jgi:NAD-dependent deacetylase
MTPISNAPLKETPPMTDLIQKAAQDIHNTTYVTALTGAGMSAESGIPTFRDQGGFWEKYDPEVYAHIDTFSTHPEKPWLMVREFNLMVTAQPNPGHLALTALQHMGYLQEIITQNVDNLHQEAGSTRVIEFHGNLRRALCLTCGKFYEFKELDLSVLPPRCACGGVLKPDAVFFGEAIPEKAYREADRASRASTLMVVVGTSAIVYPAASMPLIAKHSGAKVIEVNPEPTPLTGSVSDYIIYGTAAEVLPRIVNELQKLIEGRKGD